MKFSIKDFFSKCDQIRSKLPIWSYLLKESLMENFIFCALAICRKQKGESKGKCIFKLLFSKKSDWGIVYLLKKLILDPEQKQKFSIKDFYSKCHQIRKKMWIWSYLLKASLMKNFFFCAVGSTYLPVNTD